MGVHTAAGAAGATLRLSHLRRWRQHAGAHPCHRLAPPARAAPATPPPPAGGARRPARPPPPVSPTRRGTSLTPAAHLTCVGAERGVVDEVARQYWTEGVRHIVALRGDAPGEDPYAPHPGGYAYASDLVAGLKRVADFEITVAAYPEMHPSAENAGADLDHLKRKLDAGAVRAITQYFFDADVFLRFLDRALAAGITAPIVPGIMPVSNFAQAKKFSQSCGASVPDWMARLFEGTEDDPETRRTVGAVIAAEQVRVLQANGVDEFHFYTLNRPDLTYAIAHILGVRPLVSGDSSAMAAV